MTRDSSASAAAVAAVRVALADDAQLVELVGVIAAYNMVSRFINTLDIEPEAGNSLHSHLPTPSSEQN